MVFLYNPTEGEESLGAGFLVDKSGIILTNWHVTKGTKNFCMAITCRWICWDGGII